MEIGFKKKELEKVLAFGSVVEKYIRKDTDTIIDLCSGNGLCGFAFQFNNLARKSLMIDIKQPKRFERIKRLFEDYGFKYEYFILDINADDFKLKDFYGLKDSFILSIHPCSDLGDRVIELALDSKIPFALMTCCHKVKNKKYTLKNPPDPRLMLYEEPADYFDLVRKRHIEEKGWKCYWEEIPKEITPKNHVLIGVKE